MTAYEHALETLNQKRAELAQAEAYLLREASGLLEGMKLKPISTRIGIMYDSIRYVKHNGAKGRPVTTNRVVRLIEQLKEIGAISDDRSTNSN